MASSFPHLLFHAYMSMYVNLYSQYRLFSTYNVLWIHVLRAENLALDNNTTSSTSNFPQLATVLVFFFFFVRLRPQGLHKNIVMEVALGYYS